MSSRRCVALLAIGGSHWIAGVNYVVSLARALRSLPDEERPEILLVENPDGEFRLYKEIYPITTLVRWPDAVGWRGRMQRLWPGKRPAPLKALVAELKERNPLAVFPVKGRKLAAPGLPWIPWVVDFQHKYFPDFFTKEYVAEREALHIWLIQNSPRVVLSSQSALEDCDAAYPGHREKLHVLRFRSVPVPQWFEGDPARMVRRYEIPAKFIVAPNQFFAHKNHRTLFEAIAIARDRGHDVHLVCTGQTEDFRDPGHFPRLQQQIKDRGMEKHIRILGLIPRLEQVQLIRAAAAVVQASLFEGWSTVVEDARALGKRIFLSDIPVHREQNPPGVTYFDPNRPEALADAIGDTWAQLPSPAPLETAAEAEQRHGPVVRQYARDFLQIAGS